MFSSPDIVVSNERQLLHVLEINERQLNVLDVELSLVSHEVDRRLSYVQKAFIR